MRGKCIICGHQRGIDPETECCQGCEHHRTCNGCHRGSDVAPLVHVEQEDGLGCQECSANHPKRCQVRERMIRRAAGSVC